MAEEYTPKSNGDFFFQGNEIMKAFSSFFGLNFFNELILISRETF